MLFVEGEKVSKSNKGDKNSCCKIRKHFNLPCSSCKYIDSCVVQDNDTDKSNEKEDE